MGTIGAVIGELFEGGFFGGRVRAKGNILGVVWAPKAAGSREGPWMTTTGHVKRARSHFDSMANTQAMAQGGSPLAEWALSLDIGGYRDWCIPARDVLELAYRHLKPSQSPTETNTAARSGDNPSSMPPGYCYSQSPVMATACRVFSLGEPEAFTTPGRLYWTSTEYDSERAWVQSFTSGLQNDFDKLSPWAEARAVRFIKLGKVPAMLAN